MKLTILGCSDAFGSGGRLQTSYHLTHSAGECLVDCGATALIGLAREGLDPNRIGTIFITHLHGDHFSGLVWWLIHAVHVARRRTPLIVVGPAGIEERFTTAAEALFPGATTTPRAFDLQFLSFEPEVPLTAGGVMVTPYVVSHPSGATSFALRCEADGSIFAYSGDTEWIESLIPTSAGADLFLVDCYAFQKEARYHMNWRTIEQQLPRIDAKRIMLTHMGPEMLDNLSAVSNPRILIAEDGLSYDLAAQGHKSRQMRPVAE